MKKCFILFIVFVIISVGTLTGEKTKNNHLYLEVFFGQSFISPEDLNLFSAYQKEYYEYYYNYYRVNYNHSYSRATSNGIIGEFNKLKNNNIFGGRLKYYFSSNSELRKLAISLSFKYINGKSDSNAEMIYNIDNFYAGIYSLTRKTEPSRLYTEGYVPQIGVHYPVLNSRKFSLEANISAGLIFASCGSFEQYYYNKTEPTGYIDKMTIIQEYKGTGTGLSLDAGLKLEAIFNKSIGIFLEGGYSYQKVNKITGDAMYKRSDKDNNMDGYVSLYNWSGDWIISEQSYGNKPNVNHNGLDQSALSNFNLDLSGFYLRVGLSIKIF